MGLLAAREIVTGQKEALWEINTDTEYQEKAAISDTGFKPAAAPAAAPAEEVGDKKAA